MPDPLGELEDALAYMFELQTAGDDYYINSSVKKLKKAIDNYKKTPAETFDPLIIAIINALPVIDNYVDSYRVKKKMELLAETRGRSILWYKSKKTFYPYN